MDRSPENPAPGLPDFRVGARVMVRRRLTDTEIAAAAGTLDAGRTLTDVVGTVVELTQTTAAVVIETRRGREDVALDSIVTWKPLGPKPVRRGAPHRAVGINELEELMVDGWRPREQQWMGRWLLRAADGYTGRANSCLVLGEPDRPLDEALSEVKRWYAERELEPLLHLPLAPGHASHDDPFVAEAGRHGWEAFLPVLVMTAASAVMAQSAGSGSAAHIAVTPDLSDEWWELADERARDHESAARRIYTASDDQCFLTVRQDGESLAHARLALSPGWGGIFVVATREDAGRQGHARRLVAACAREAAAAGASSLYLQVAADNDGAIALYESMGFTTHHTYVYLRPTA